jgi:hypothetical protein
MESAGLLSTLVPHPFPFHIARKLDWVVRLEQGRTKSGNEG